MNRNRNAYQLLHTTQTTGWDPLSNDVNGTNFFNMTPAQVAVQAGDVSEFHQIVAHPQFEPEKMGSLAALFSICREHDPKRHKAFMEYFNNEFRRDFAFDASRKVFMRIQ